MPRSQIATKSAVYWKNIGLPDDKPALHRALVDGVKYDVLRNIANYSGLTIERLAEAAVIKPATLRRRASSGRLNRIESDAIYRLAEIFKATIDLFDGDIKGAQTWIVTPAEGLGGKRPIDLISSTAGHEMVLTLIGQLEYGVLV